MAGKTEFWSDEEIDYKEELLDRFSDTDLSKWKLRQHGKYSVEEGGGK